MLIIQQIIYQYQGAMQEYRHWPRYTTGNIRILQRMRFSRLLQFKFSLEIEMCITTVCILTILLREKDQGVEMHITYTTMLHYIII